MSFTHANSTSKDSVLSLLPHCAIEFSLYDSKQPTRSAAELSPVLDKNDLEAIKTFTA